MSTSPTGPHASVGCADALADDLGWGLGVVFRAYLAAADAAVADLPGGPRGYQVLSTAARGLVGSQLALAQHLGIDRTVMTYLLDDLEELGVIERQPDPADRRARMVVATPKGNELLATLDDALQAAEDEVLAPLTDEERRAFRAHLQAVARHASTLDPAPSPCELAADAAQLGGR